MKSTIKKLSEMAHVTKSTVSKALNGQKGVSEEKRQEIMRLASEINYRPNANARALAHQKTEMIGLVIPPDARYSLSGAYWSEIIASVADEANKNNYNLLLIVAEKNAIGKTLENVILKRSVDGLIVAAEQITTEEISMLDTSGIPFVIQGRSPLCSHCCVDVRNQDGAEMLTKKLVDKGYKNIGCISGPDSFLYVKERIAGFRNVIKAAGLNDAMVMNTYYSEEETVKNTRQFIQTYPDLDALFITGGGDFVFYIIDTLKEEKINLKKFGFAVFDDYMPFRFLPFPIISARQPIKQMGTQDAKLLFQLIDKEDPPLLSLFDISIA